MKDANDFLLSNRKLITELIHKATTIPNSRLTKFEYMKDIIKERLMNQESYRGISVGLKYFNKIVKGVRLG